MTLSKNVTHKNGVIQFNGNTTKFNFADFSMLYKEYDSEVGESGHKTREVETFARDVINNGLIRPDIMDLIGLVCLWGSQDNLVSSMKSDIMSNGDRIGVVFRDADQSIQDGNIDKAADDLCSLVGIELSMASKFLRMLYPEKCVAFDKKHLQKDLPYSPDKQGYAVFCSDCQCIATMLTKNGLGEWRAADVEAVIFHVIRK